LINDIHNVLKWIDPNDRVLDVGGGVQVFQRANAVIDLLAFDLRQLTKHAQGMEEAFSSKDWYVGDICSPDVWSNFQDKEFDFVVCSHTLEDIRDPIFVCSQLIRVAKAGYIEVPSRFRECLKGNLNSIVSGWEHHRWVIDVEDGTVAFTMKHPFFNHFDFLGERRRERAFDYLHQFTGIHWVGSFNYVERSQKGSPVETENMFYFYDHYNFHQNNPVHKINNIPFAGRTFDWTHQLPIEKVMTIERIMQQHNKRLRHEIPLYKKLWVIFWNNLFKGKLLLRRIKQRILRQYVE